MTIRSKLADVLRAEACGCDTSPGPFGLHIYAMREDGTLYELGSIHYAALGPRSQDGVYRAVERIKFGQINELLDTHKETPDA